MTGASIVATMTTIGAGAATATSGGVVGTGAVNIANTTVMGIVVARGMNVRSAGAGAAGVSVAA